MNKKDELISLRKVMEEDETLPLRKVAKKLVFGEGNPDAFIMFIGEGPGYWEDQKGVPFVGNAGKFLDYLLSLIKIRREEVFITNMVHHRPPGNRDPFPSEIENYGRYLDRIIKIVKPKIIITLGRFSMAKFLPNEKITKAHGKLFKVEHLKMRFYVIPMFHPAAGLRNERIKKILIEDFSKIPLFLEKIKKEASIYQEKLINF